MLSRQEASLVSTRGRGGGGFEATDLSVRDDYGEDGWVPCGGKVPLSQWFSYEVVSSLASSVGLTSSGWVKSSVIRFIYVPFYI